MEDKIYEIIALSFSEIPLSKEEELLLQEWLEASISNRSLYETFCRMQDGSEIFRKIGGPDRSQAWSKVCKKSGFLFITHRRNWRMVSIAAGFFLLCAVGIGILWFRAPSESVLSNNTRLSLPAATYVLLKLNNGKNINLASAGSNIVVSEGGMQASCDSNTISYRENNTCSTDSIVEYNTLVVPQGAEYRIVLSDGTRVHVNAASELRYPAVFSKSKREVYLSGEAYFDVQSDTSRHFVVKTANMDIRVLGTSFNVNAYNDMDVVTATLVSGKIRASCDGVEYDIVPGSQIHRNSLTGRAEIEEVNTDLFTSWKDGYYYFEACRLEDIMQTLSRWYDIRPFFANPELKDMQFTGRFKRYEDVEQIFRKFEKTRNVNFSRKGNCVTICTI